jgi:hypothetical protein
MKREADMNDAGVKFDDRHEEGPAGSRNKEETVAQPLNSNFVPDGFATDALDETHMLLAYAASSGIDIEPEVSEAIARARAANERHNWNADIEAKFWPAKSKLSQSVKTGYNGEPCCRGGRCRSKGHKEVLSLDAFLERDYCANLDSYVHQYFGLKRRGKPSQRERSRCNRSA